ncbi:MAG TPA: hypothetical protein K8V35_08785 [Aliicoccus persicus]|uniref:Uncharacterized protein n=1 Tax=Aliicoccus persicus TaxID=930138 RepID=A0A921DYC1_9STAP|nr:hypothetical protein [Aliicoccus persicus]
MNQLEEVKIKQSKGGQLFIVILSIIMTLASVFVIFIGMNDDNIFMIIIGVIGTLFFGLALILLVKSLVSKKYVLILNEDGFYDYSSALSTNDTLIPWDQVTRVELVQVTSEIFVALTLKNPEIAKNARSKMGNMFAKANKGLGYADVLVTTKTAKGYNAETVGQLMYEYWVNTVGVEEITSRNEKAELKDLDEL